MLSENHIDVWKITGDDGSATLLDLAPEERVRSLGMADPTRRKVFVRMRTALRRILGAELGMAPARVEIVEDAVRELSRASAKQVREQFRFVSLAHILSGSE